MLSWIKKYGLKFGGIGVLNTLVQQTSYGLFLLMGMTYLMAQGVSFGMAVGVSFVLNATWNYQVPLTIRRGLSFLGATIPSFLLQRGMLKVLVQSMGVSEYLAMFLTLGVTIPLSFLLTTISLLKQPK